MNKLKFSFVVGLVLIFVLSTINVKGQTNDKGFFVKIEVENNEADGIVRYSGYVAEGTNRDTLYLTTRSLRTVKIPFHTITKMESKRGIALREEPEHTDIEEREHDTYNFREHGFYASLGTEFNFKTDDGGPEVHPGIDLTLGYKFNRLFAIGVGASIRSWTYDIWPNAVGHIYAEARGWLMKKGASPYYRFKIGYGNSWGGGTGNYQSSKGGLHYTPAIGIRLINSRVMNLNIETGFNHQEITYEDLDFGSFERKYSFNRHYIGISMMY